MRYLSVLSAFTAVCCAFSPVGAADMRAVDAGWGGAYLGGHVAGGWGQSFAANGDLIGGGTHRGVLAGVHGGYMWQRHSLVFGVEGDVALANLSHDLYLVGPGFSDDFKFNNNGIVSVRARLGLDGGQVLIYGTGGYAVSHMRMNETFVVPAGRAVFDASGLVHGYVLGGGLEWKLNETLLFRVEGLRYQFSHAALDGSVRLTALSETVEPATATFSHTLDVVKIGLSYKF